MKASELRIGNKLFYDTFDIDTAKPKKEIVFVTPGIIKEIAISPNHSYETIPLAPQWLLAAGFEKISNDVYSIPLPNGNGVDLVLEWEDCCIKRNHVGKEKKDGDKNPYDYAYIKAPRHIHQLQNLYHALTGHELEFDLTKINSHE